MKRWLLPRPPGEEVPATNRRSWTTFPRIPENHRLQWKYLRLHGTPGLHFPESRGGTGGGGGLQTRLTIAAGCDYSGPQVPDSLGRGGGRLQGPWSLLPFTDCGTEKEKDAPLRRKCLTALSSQFSKKGLGRGLYYSSTSASRECRFYSSKGGETEYRFRHAGGTKTHKSTAYNRDFLVNPKELHHRNKTERKHGLLGQELNANVKSPQSLKLRESELLASSNPCRSK